MKLLSKLVTTTVLGVAMSSCASTTPTPAPAAAPAPAASTAPAPASAPEASSAPASTPAAASTAPDSAPVATPAASAATEATAPAAAVNALATPVAPAAVAPAPAATAATAAPAAPAVADNAPLPDVVKATIHVPAGDIHVSLFHKSAPITVENFVKLARANFYDGLAFHRVEPGFVVQGGDPNSREGASGEVGAGGPGYTIPAEIGPTNPEKHLPGTLGMADSGLNTAGSQFYITLAATPHLDGRYTVFGRVDTEADLDVVGKVNKGDRFTVTIIPPTPAR